MVGDFGCPPLLYIKRNGEIMDNNALLEKLFVGIKEFGSVNPDKLEDLFFEIIVSQRKEKEKLKRDIQVITGKMIQIDTTEQLLIRMLKVFLSKMKGEEADEERTASLEKMRRSQAEHRLKKAMDVDGLDPFAPPIKARREEIPVPEEVINGQEGKAEQAEEGQAQRRHQGEQAEEGQVTSKRNPEEGKDDSKILPEALQLEKKSTKKKKGLRRK